MTQPEQADRAASTDPESPASPASPEPPAPPESPAPAAVGGNRLRWADLPADVRTGIERLLRARVVEDASQPGGFSPGLAARLRLDDGRRVFAKAIGAERSPEAYAMHTSEARITRALPPETPAPRLLRSYDDGHWAALVFQDVAGHQPAEPWKPAELDRVLAAMAQLSEALTPSPLALEPAAAWDLHDWRTIAAEQEKQQRVRRFAPWALDHLDQLVALERRWPEAATGDTMLHFDLRADNILLTDDRVMFVDWPHARVGEPAIELLAMLPSIAMHGTDPAPIAAAHPTTAHLDPERIDAILAAFAGFFVGSSLRPVNPLLPTIRDFQRAQGIATLAWLDSRLAAR